MANFFIFILCVHTNAYRIFCKMQSWLNDGFTYETNIKVNKSHWASYTSTNFPFQFVIFLFFISSFLHFFITMIVFRMTFYYISPAIFLLNYIISIKSLPLLWARSVRNEAEKENEKKKNNNNKTENHCRKSISVSSRKKKKNVSCIIHPCGTHLSNI